MSLATFLAFALRFNRITELTTCMGHTAHMHKIIGGNHRIVDVITTNFINTANEPA